MFFLTNSLTPHRACIGNRTARTEEGSVERGNTILWDSMVQRHLGAFVKLNEFSSLDFSSFISRRVRLCQCRMEAGDLKPLEPRS